MTDLIAGILINLIIVLYFVLYVSGQRIAGKRRLREWADKEGCVIKSIKFCYFSRGPFKRRTTMKKLLYHVTVEYPNSEIKTAWILIGNFIFGPYMKSYEVKWDKN